MIYDELYDLKQYIVSKCGINCEIGNSDTDPDSYPLIQVLFEEAGLFHFMTVKEGTFDMPVTLRLIVSKGQELEAFKSLDKLFLKINQFNDHKGNKTSGDISPEYDEETKTYKIEVLYNLKILILDKE